MSAQMLRRAAVWRAHDRRWVSEKGHEHSEFKVFAVPRSPIDPDKDSVHRTWREAMANALAYVARGDS